MYAALLFYGLYVPPTLSKIPAQYLEKGLEK